MKAKRELHYWRVVIVYTDNEASGHRVFKDREKAEHGPEEKTFESPAISMLAESRMGWPGLSGLNSGQRKVEPSMV